MGGLLQGDAGAGADRLQLFGRLLLTFIFLFQVNFDSLIHSVCCTPKEPLTTNLITLFL